MENATLLVNEVFKSLQGEGKSIGYPVTFIRTWGCSLGCKNCDSRYSWDMTGSLSANEKNKMTYEDFIQALKNAGGNLRHWVITGGEPLLQQNIICGFVDRFTADYGYKPFIEWETNGTIKPLENTDLITDQYNVSPKLSCMLSGKKQETFTQRIKEDAMRFFAKNDKAYFKIVVASEQDLIEIDEIEKFIKIDKEKIWLMPMGMYKKELDKVSPWLFNYCVARHYKFSPRLHIMLFDYKRKI